MFRGTLISLLFILAGCTFSFNNVSTEGHSSDTMSEQLKSDADIEPVLDIPAGEL